MEAAGKRWITYGSRASEFTIWNLSDLHLMSAACAEKDLLQDVEQIRNDPCSFWMGGGDYCDFIGYSDRRFDPDAVADWVSIKDLGKLGRIGMRRVRDILAPIQHKGLGLLLGNHEKQYALRTEQEDLHGWLCQELDLPNLQYCALFDLIFARRPGVKGPRSSFSPPEKHTGDSSTIRVFAHHGAGYAQTPGGKLNRLVQFMQSFRADIFFCGHVHDKVGRKEPTIGANRDCTKLEAYEKVGVIAGSYLKTYAQGTTTYGEQRGYRPTSLGAAWVRYNPKTGKFAAEV